jgi:serine/threonine protein kinase
MQRFVNEERLSALLGLIQKRSHSSLRELKESMVKTLKAKNKAVHKDLMATRLVQDFSENVYEAQLSSGESIVVKHCAWDDDNIDDFSEFNELAANIAVVGFSSPNFVKMLDCFIIKDTLHLLFPKLEGDIETLPDLGEPDVMWDIFYQLARALCDLQAEAEIVHFDIRSDNILVETLDEPQVLFADFPYKSKYLLKLADLGLAEMTFHIKGKPARVRSSEIDRDDVSIWGTWPLTFCPGYDFQYFLYSMIPVLQTIGFLDQFYVHAASLAFVEEGLDLVGEANRTEEWRPHEVSKKTALETRHFLEDFYHNNL